MKHWLDTLDISRMPRWPILPVSIDGEGREEWITRVCAAYGMTFQEMSKAIMKELRLLSSECRKEAYYLQSSPCWSDKLILRLFGLPFEDLDKFEARNYPLERRAPGGAFCPWCWREDARLKLPLKLRGIWSETSLTMCHQHCLPLYYGEIPFSNKARLKIADDIASNFDDTNDEAMEILTRVRHFERHLYLDQLRESSDCLELFEYVRSFLRCYLPVGRGGYFRDSGLLHCSPNPILARWVSSDAYKLVFCYHPSIQRYGDHDGMSVTHCARAWTYTTALVLWLMGELVAVPMYDLRAHGLKADFDNLEQKISQTIRLPIYKILNDVIFIEEEQRKLLTALFPLLR